MQEQILRIYIEQLAETNHKYFEQIAKNNTLEQELLELQNVLNSDETLKALFDEQKQKVGGK